MERPEQGSSRGTGELGMGGQTEDMGREPAGYRDEEENERNQWRGRGRGRVTQEREAQRRQAQKKEAGRRNNRPERNGGAREGWMENGERKGADEGTERDPG